MAHTGKWRTIIENSFLVVLLIPLLFTNIKSSHDWGDDFAQYLHQAKNICEGISQNETGYIFNADAFLGPQAYPVGFPLLLAPVIKVCGIDYAAITIYLSAYLLLSCFIGFLLLRNYFSVATAMIVTLIIAYNPVTLSFKTEILSDIPFFFFSLLILFLALKKQTTFLSIMIGALLGFCFHIRSVTVTLLVSIVLHRFILLIQEKQFRFSAFKEILLILASFALVYFSIRAAWPADSSYPELFDSKAPFLKAMDHLSYHNEELHRFFRNYDLKNFFFILCLSASALTCFTWLGFFHQLKHNRYSLLNIYTLLYVAALMLYMYGDTGIRFIFPVMFILFYYAIIGLKNALHTITTNYFWLPYLIGFFVLFSYHESWQRISEHEAEVLDGPETKSSQETFSYIVHNTATDAVMAFDKPRALSLYTQRSAVCFKNECSREEFVSSLNRFKVDYVIVYSGLTSETNKNLAADSTLHLKKVFDNGTGKIYRYSGH